MDIKQGMILYTDTTPIGFGKYSKTPIKNQAIHNKKAWPKYTKSGYLVKPIEIDVINMKHINSIVGNPIMNS